MGFFYSNKKKVAKKASGRKELPTEILRKHGCRACPLKKTKESGDFLSPTGSDTPRIYILGAAPTEDDLDAGQHFSDKYGQLLLDCLPEKLQEEIAFGYCTECFPKERDVDPRVLECCRSKVLQDISDCRPEIIVGVGHIPLKLLLSHYNITNWRGRRIPVEVNGHVCWYYPLLSPDYVIKKRKKRGNKIVEGELDHIFRLDIDRILWELKKQDVPIVEPATYFENITTVNGSKGEQDLRKIQKFLDRLAKEPEIGIDIEAKNLRPYKRDSRILTVAIGTYDETIAFPLEHPEGWKKKKYREQAWELLYDFLLKSGKKICHNLEFEQEWFSYFLGNEVLRHPTNKVIWGDTFAQAYLIDNRKAMHSLELCTMIYLGFNLKSIIGHSLDMKNLDLEPIDLILKYNALDSKYTHKLFKVLEPIIARKELTWAYDHLIRLAPTLVLAQQAGIKPNKERLEWYKKDLTVKIADVERRIAETIEAKKYRRRTGKVLVPSSNKELERLFRDILQRPEGKKAGGSYTTDESALKAMPADEVPIAKLLIEYRGHTKLLSTYVDGIIDIIDPDGLIHTNYQSKFTVTGRLCVAEGTKIATSTTTRMGVSELPIEEIVPGDLVYSYDEQGKITVRPVEWAGVTGRKSTVLVSAEAKTRNSRLELTPKHGIRLACGVYREASLLEKGTEVLSLVKESTLDDPHQLDLEDLSIITSVVPTDRTVNVYDLTVADTHNFIANGICISNSSSDPNSQNFPKRKNKHVRTVIGAPEGGWIVSADYGQIEARVLGMLSEDKVFCDALWNDYDVHMEWAQICADAYNGGTWAKIQEENPDVGRKGQLRIYRGDIKNGLVFPWFYGASRFSVGAGLGIPDNIMKDIYGQFWSTFKGVKKWQDTLVSFYDRHGYVKTATGRRRVGPINLNELINMPIQGTASDIVTSGMIALSELEPVSGRSIAKTQARMNIHDDLTFYIMDGCLDDTIEDIAKGMCFAPIETFDFITVPISIEVEIGRDWGSQKEYGVYKSTEWGHTR